MYALVHVRVRVHVHVRARAHATERRGAAEGVWRERENEERCIENVSCHLLSFDTMREHSMHSLVWEREGGWGRGYPPSLDTTSDPSIYILEPSSLFKQNLYLPAFRIPAWPENRHT